MKKILTLVLALLLALSLLPASALAADVDESAYSAIFDEVREKIQEEYDIIGSDSYPSDDISECSYAFYDIDGNGVAELIFMSKGATAYIYTLFGGEGILLAQWRGYRDAFAGINERGYIYGGGGSSAWSGGISYVRIAADGKSVETTYVGYDYKNDASEFITITTPDGRSMGMSEAEGDSYVKTNFEAPLIELTGWKTLTEQSGRITARQTSSAVLVNGANVSFDAYNINDNNYFKLRDLAYILSGTEAQFEVEWDAANNAIRLTSGRAYTAVGGEMTGKGAGEKTPVLTSSKILLDGAEISLTAYNIDGNNYFKLRDIGAALDFEIDWDGAKNTIVIDTTKGYTAD